MFTSFNWESKNRQFWEVELDTFAICVKIVSKIIVWGIDAKLLISNQLSVAYKLYLYKILIKDAIEAHRDYGSIA